MNFKLEKNNYLSLISQEDLLALVRDPGRLTCWGIMDPGKSCFDIFLLSGAWYPRESDFWTQNSNNLAGGFDFRKIRLKIKKACWTVGITWVNVSSLLSLLSPVNVKIYTFQNNLINFVKQ